ncbi:zinc finger, c3HC4 type (RING finger) domain-containing protein [Phthorimaea operculella]|nr:zinc finger, c3HC4 type (RING finger) domain-containing protein [Phthorimaea operculella]
MLALRNFRTSFLFSYVEPRVQLETMADSQSNDNNTCVVCFKNVEYYSIGECDHPVCFECSTRMRVLCLQNECPICRQALSRVVFTDTVKPYKELRNQVFSDRLFERQFKIGFCTETIKQAYEKLLENRCKLCDNIPPFRTFNQLNDHVRKVHERFFCDLCVKHLKCYTRQELAHHRRKGDLDDTSHRGHPLCEFCEERFMDADELYRHLRKEHLYCHLCDADGRNLYYASHNALAHHFRTDHFLCEEGDCAGNHLTAVFRTEIDLKAHKATVHGKGMTRGAARQARTIEVQFNITPHSAQIVQRTPRDRERDREPPREPSPPPPAPAPPRIDTRSDAQFPRLSAAPPQPNLLLGAPNCAYRSKYAASTNGRLQGTIPLPQCIDTRSDAQFPRLSAAPPQPNLLLGAPNRAYRSVDGLARTDKNFPTLGGGPAPAPPAGSSRTSAPAKPAAAILRNSKPSVSIQLHSQPASASNFRLQPSTGNRNISIPPQQQRRNNNFDEDDFPSLGGNVPKDDHPSLGAGTMQPPKVAMINSQEMAAMKSSQPTQQKKKPPPASGEAFPALSTTSAPAHPPQWITVDKGKGKAKAKPEPPPQPKQPAFNPVADFPGLPVNNKKNKKQNQPQATPVTPRAQPPPAPKPQPTVTSPQENKQTKKDKKKQAQKNAINLMKENNEPTVPSYVNGFSDKLSKSQIKEAYAAAMSLDNDAPSNAASKIKTINDEGTSAEKKNNGNGDFALAPNDFPSLSGGVSKASKASKRAPNGNPPPGFGARPPCDGMTFTNSAGQTFTATPHSYLPPPDFERRNRLLVEKLVDALGSNAAVEEFKEASRAFRDDAIDAEEFYAHCRRAMGKKLDAAFPELVALLPDIRKQQELACKREKQHKLVVCSTCGQLLAADDARSHETEHWPPLAS